MTNKELLRLYRNALTTIDLIPFWIALATIAGVLVGALILMVDRS